MATKKGPTKGGRIPVKLPFGDTKKPVAAAGGKAAKPGKSQIVLIKQNVAKFMGWKPITEYDIQTVSTKTAAGEVPNKRIARVGSFRRESITLILDKPRKIGDSPGTYKTVNIPLGSGCTVADAIKWFQANGKTKGIIGVRTANGQRYQWDFAKAAK
jgi:hypothetical protein